MRSFLVCSNHALLWKWNRSLLVFVVACLMRWTPALLEMLLAHHLCEFFCSIQCSRQCFRVLLLSFTSGLPCSVSLSERQVVCWRRHACEQHWCLSRVWTHQHPICIITRTSSVQMFAPDKATCLLVWRKQKPSLYENRCVRPPQWYLWLLLCFGLLAVSVLGCRFGACWRLIMVASVAVSMKCLNFRHFVSLSVLCQ